MLLKLTAHIEAFPNSQYIAWVDNDKFKGTVVQASSPRQAWLELLLSLKIKIAYDYNIQIDSIAEKEVSTPEELDALFLQENGKKDINLVLQ